MIRRSFRNTAISLIVLFCVVISTMPAYAVWETGINVITTAEEQPDKSQDFDTPEEFAAEVIKLVNSERVNKGLSEFCRMEELCRPAAIRAQESADLFAHIRPNGSKCSTVYSDCGLTYKAAGENLAYGFSTPADLVKAWMSSKSHRENILSANYMYAEAGFFINAEGVIYCSLILYTPKQT